MPTVISDNAHRVTKQLIMTAATLSGLMTSLNFRKYWLTVKVPYYTA